jgi:hypothetical protein
MLTMLKTSPAAVFAPLLLSLSTIACGGSDARSDSLFGGDSLTLGNDASDGDDSSGEDPSGSESEIKLDTQDEEGMTTAGSESSSNAGCQAIDFLFVIDNSGSMGDEQENLIASFPGFIEKIQATIADVDSYHIMVVDTDSTWNTCTIECDFFPGLCVFDGVDGCSGPPTVCDATLGAGVNFPLGNNASNQYCDLTGGQRYITPQEPLDLLPQRFTCIGSVGTDGDASETPMAAMTAAISDALNGPGGCNTGFLRDDAVLVITIITDEEDSNSPGTPAGWYQSVVAQKAGDGSGVVVLGLINDTDADTPLCSAEAQDPAKIREFIQLFPNQITGSVCEPNYAPFFEQAVDLINTTCDEFEPVG